MEEAAMSIYTQGRVEITLEQLVELFGSAPHSEVPLASYRAEVIANPGEAVAVLFHCRLTKELFAKLAPDLAAVEDAMMQKYEGWETSPENYAHVRARVLQQLADRTKGSTISHVHLPGCAYDQNKPDESTGSCMPGCPVGELNAGGDDCSSKLLPST